MKKTKAPKTKPTKPDTKCRAAEVGHRSCTCGAPGCGGHTTGTGR